MATSLDHVTLAVRDLTADAARISDALGLVVDSDTSTIRLGSSSIELTQQSDREPGWLSYALRGHNLDHAAGSGGVLPRLAQRAAGSWEEPRHPLGATGISAVGLAVADLEAWTPTFIALTGQPPMRNTVAFVQARRANWLLNDGSLLRLLSPEQPGTGAVAEHLAQRGEGVFIVRLAVRNTEHAVAELRQRGTAVSERQADGTVFLLDPDRTLGARFALVEV